jgi:hypothetical protein
MKEKRGFIPDASIKKIILRDGATSNGYLYRDGVVIVEKRNIKSGKEEFQKEFVHIFPCELAIHIHNPFNVSFVGGLVIHDPSVLLDGVREVSVYFNNKSTSMEERGITCNTVTIRTQSGMKIKDHIFDFISSNVTIQNEQKESIMDWDTYRNDLVWHGEKPTKKEEEVTT